MPLLAAVSLLSTAALAYEILLTRLFAITLSHHFVSMIISLALLGYGASGTFLMFTKHRLLKRFNESFAILAGAFALATIACTVITLRIPFNPLEVVWDWRQQLYLSGIYLVLAVPFFCAASAIGLSFAALPTQIGNIYCADLAGAGGGALGIVLALFLLPPESALRLIAIAGIGAALLAVSTSRFRFGVSISALLVVAVLIVPQDWLRPTPSPYKALSVALTVPGTRVIAERSGPLGRLTVIESPQIPLRHAPGLSLAHTAPLPDQLGIFTDGDGMTAITRFDGNIISLDYLDRQITAAAYQLARRDEVLVLGAGGGADVLLPLYHRASRIDAVDANAQLIELAREDFAEFGGGLYESPQVDVHIADARSFTEASDREWDVINIALLDSFAAAAVGAQALNESPIYTIEAIQTYLDHLAPNGVVSITRWLGDPPRDVLKLLATAIVVLEKGGKKPADRLALLHSWNTATLLIKNEPFSAAEIGKLRRFAADRQFDLAWYPGMESEDANRYHTMPVPTLYDAATALFGHDRPNFVAQYPFNIEPASDDRPFFFRFFKWGLLPQLLEQPSQGGWIFVDSGYLVLVLALVQAVVLAFVLILLPLVLLKREVETSTSLDRTPVFMYFLLIGLAFLLVEIAFIHRFSLFLGHPLSAIAVSLMGFLVSAGLGSATSRRFAQRLNAPILIAVGPIIVIGVIYTLLLPALFNIAIGWPMAAKIGIALVSIAPLGFCMGLPFPLGLSLVAKLRPALVPWAWGINGCASVVAAVLASLMAMHLGFTVVLIVALGFYAAAALTMGMRSKIAPS